LTGNMVAPVCRMKTLLSLFLFAGFAHAADLRIFVEARGRGLTNEVQSYLARELRSLGDVSVVSDTERFDFEIQTIVTPLAVGEKVTGYILSFLVTTPFPTEVFDGCFTNGCCTAEMVKTVKMLAATHDAIAYMGTSVAPRTELREWCGKIVVEIDREALEPHRKQKRAAETSVPRTVPK
jgi:hypothetical protein